MTICWWTCSAPSMPGRFELGVTNLFNNHYLPVINQAFNSQFANVRGPGRRISIGYRVSY
ncbi:hypothetical protein [Yunchengibacter salinarum]|uniref:hypothetical protein n=1 Tax=Yunchengibacter salinarum TaxID=3133399 RepID=UPI0035B65AE9